MKDEPNFTSEMFYFTVDGKKVSGLMNVPKKAGTYPVLVMFRGFVDRSVYSPGEGDRRTAEYFAQNGFVTLTPDFLGYGQSDKEASDPMEDRFQTYTTGLELLASVKNLNAPLSATNSEQVQIDPEKVGIWGHSNGGHIALSVLSITGKPYPTVLWNPVSAIFPYSILYFIDEYDDHGRGLIKLVADFESRYDAERYSPPNYYKYITAPIQLNQALADEEVPVKWSNQLNDTLKKQGVDITYTTYPGENHNFNNGSWNVLVKSGLDFYIKEFSK
jgi:dipeptidyl aminopeptidase/acylaminoacyl peptidase